MSACQIIEVLMRRELIYKIKYFAPSVPDAENSALKLEQLPDPISDRKTILYAGVVPTSERRS